MLLQAPPLESQEDTLLYYERSSRAQAQIATVRRYLDEISHELEHSAFKRRTFVQLFAEPGMYRNRATQEWFVGAALHALTLTGFNYYFYTSLNHQVLEALERRYRDYFARPDRQAFFLGGNCNDLSRGIISETEFYILTQRGTRPLNSSSTNGSARTALPVPATLTFCLYQNGVHLNWETVVMISRLPYVNLILYYPKDALNRQMPQANAQRGETDVDAFFGGKAWRDLYHRGIGQSRHDHLIPYYCERLQSLGFQEIVTERELNGLPDLTEGEPSDYFLIFAHKQPKGEAFWTKVGSAT